MHGVCPTRRVPHGDEGRPEPSARNRFNLFLRPIAASSRRDVAAHGRPIMSKQPHPAGGPSRAEDPRATDWGLYRARYERDSCGFGLIASLDDQPSHWVVQTAISSLNRLTHRGAIATDGKTGDGCGLLIKKPAAIPARVAARSRKSSSRRSSRRASCSWIAIRLRRMPRAPGARRADRARELERCGLSRRARRPSGLRRRGAADAAAHRAAVRELPDSTSTRPRSTGGCYMARRRAEKILEASDPAFYMPLAVGEHHRLQGHGDAAAPGASSTPISRIRGWRPRWWCSTSASRPIRLPQWRLAHPVPLSRPQRRDQHRAGQPLLGGGARPVVPLAAAAGSAARCCRGLAHRLGLADRSTTCSSCC